MTPLQKDLSSTASTTPIHAFLPHPIVPEEDLVNGTMRRAVAEQSHNAENPQHQWGEVIVLIGTSSVGKSSIISELIKQKPGMIEHGIDLAVVNIRLTFLNTNQPEEMAFLRQVIEPTEMDIKSPGHILDYILADTKPNFKAHISSKDRARYAEAVQKLKRLLLPQISKDILVKHMMDQIMIDSKRGSPVVCDALQIKEIVEHTFTKHHSSIKFALIYVPFQTLAERVKGRNDEALAKRDFLNAVPGLFPLEQFTKIFRPKRDDNDVVVQKLTFKEVDYAIDTVYESAKAFWEKYDPTELERRDLQKEKTESRTKILKKLGFKEGNEPGKAVELTPRFKGYHILINTAQTNKPKAESIQESIELLFKI